MSEDFGRYLKNRFKKEWKRRIEDRRKIFERQNRVMRWLFPDEQLDKNSIDYKHMEALCHYFFLRGIRNYQMYEGRKYKK